MLPADIITKLKADRRAELARTTSEAAARAEAERQQAEQAFNADLSAALAQLDATWLMQFRAAKLDVPHCDDDGVYWCPTTFDVPGHRAIRLMLTRSVGGSWVLDTSEDPIHWFADANGRDAFTATLADALIVAECRPEDRESPIPF